MSPDLSDLVDGEQHRHRGGGLLHVEVSRSHTRLGGRDAAILSVRDVTERKRAEQSRHELDETLRQAQKMDAVGRLAGGMAHDLNNVLTIILSSVELVKRDHHCASSEELAGDLANVTAAAQRAAALTRQLLTFARSTLSASLRFSMASALRPHCA